MTALGVRYYFGDKEKSLKDRLRQDDPPNMAIRSMRQTVQQKKVPAPVVTTPAPPPN